MLVSCTKPDVITLEDYQRAEKFLNINTSPLVLGTVSNQTWLDNDLLIYKNTIAEGAEFILANPATR